MGLNRDSVKLLMKEGLRRPFQGSILTLGRQNIFLSLKELKKVAEELNFPLKESEEQLSHNPQLASLGYLSDKSLFGYLGFSKSMSLDCSDYEGADYIFDLNSENVFPELQNVFDVVLDGGTMEHVFHVPNVLKNIFHMTNVEGRVIHFSPSSNHMDHGFYMFSPSLLLEYYRANQFDINNFQLIRYFPNSDFPWRVGKYDPSLVCHLSFGGLDDAMYAVYGVVTKKPFSSHDQIPQQRNYSPKVALPPPKKSLKKILKDKIYIFRAYSSLQKKIYGSRAYTLLQKYFVCEKLKLH